MKNICEGKVQECHYPFLKRNKQVENLELIDLCLLFLFLDLQSKRQLF